MCINNAVDFLNALRLKCDKRNYDTVLGYDNIINGVWNCEVEILSSDVQEEGVFDAFLSIPNFEISLYCANCSSDRLHTFQRIWCCLETDALPSYANPQPYWMSPFNGSLNSKLEKVDIKGSLSPKFYIGHCNQCKKQVLIVFYEQDGKYKLLTIHEYAGGISTPHTPDNVKYYLNQAYLSKSVGAYSASAAMYRTALEMLLLNQGYKQSMLHAKIIALEADKLSNKGKKWVASIDIAFLEAIKLIGNGAVHTNGGDHTKQQAIDMELLNTIDIVFLELLNVIYEQPITSNKRLQHLLKVSQVVK